MKWSELSVLVFVRGERGSRVMLHFNEVLPTPLSCHFDHRCRRCGCVYTDVRTGSEKRGRRLQMKKVEKNFNGDS